MIPNESLTSAASNAPLIDLDLSLDDHIQNMKTCGRKTVFLSYVRTQTDIRDRQQ